MSVSTGMSSEFRGVARIASNESTARFSKKPLGPDHNALCSDSLGRSAHILSSRMASNPANAEYMTGVGTDLPLQYSLLTKIWLSTAECYLVCKMYNDASACIEEASTLSPHSPSVYYFKGLLAEQQQDLETARKCFEMSLSLKPDHIDSLVALGNVFLECNSLVTAEKHLVEALGVDFTSHKAWYIMGKIAQARGRLEKANECFLTALSLEDTAPVVPFDTVPMPV